TLANRLFPAGSGLRFLCGNRGCGFSWCCGFGRSCWWRCCGGRGCFLRPSCFGVRIVGCIRIPLATKELRLVCYAAPLNVIVILERVMNIGSSPVASPDEPVSFGQAT